MSALGHKQTYAVQNAMSALPPIATAKADIRNGSCLLYPRKRTCAMQTGMSALGQKRTCTPLFDQLVSAPDDRIGDVDAERLGSFQVDVQLDFSGLLDWQIGGLVALEDSAGIV